MAQLEITILSLGRPGTSASAFVAEAVKVAKRSGVRYQLNAMGTTLEGDIETILRVAREMHEAPFSMGIERVYTVIKIDDRRDRESSMDGKVRSVEEKMG
ncbi:MAG TPA: MTH1187 family thiamine-binding protein [Armatimonadota bacterium]|nr:MTH1187 family thiamine-binding protein [Armatimonadota bacterium]